MGRKVITRETYENILFEYRKTPDQPYAVARRCGVDVGTVKRAYDFGWPPTKSRSVAFPPIKEVFEREKQKARSSLFEDQQAKRDAAAKERQQAIEQQAQARKAEGQMVIAVRQASLNALVYANKLTSAADKLATHVRTQVELKLADVDDPMSPSAGLHLLREIVGLQARANGLAREAMEMERLHLGAPTNVVGVISNQTEMTVEELATRVSMATNALEGARRSGGLTVLPGGLAKPVIGKLVSPAESAPASGLQSKVNGAGK